MVFESLYKSHKKSDWDAYYFNYSELLFLIRKLTKLHKSFMYEKTLIKSNLYVQQSKNIIIIIENEILNEFKNKFFFKINEMNLFVKELLSELKNDYTNLKLLNQKIETNVKYKNN